jgi:hypothetical protein
VVLIKTSFGFADCAVVMAALLMPDTAARVQLNVAPAEPLVGVYVNAVFVQIAEGVNELLKVGVPGVKETGFDAIPFATTTREYVPAGNPAGNEKLTVSAAAPRCTPVLFQLEVRA